MAGILKTKRTFHIGLLIERNRAYGRALAEGVASFARERRDMSLSFINGKTISKRTNLTSFDGFIARVVDDRIANILGATKRPVVDVFYGRPHHGFAVVESDHHATGAKAAEHFLERRFTRFAFCGDASGYSRSLANGFRRRLAKEGIDAEVYSPAKSIHYEFDAANVIDDEMGPPADGERLRRWLRDLPKPTAVFCVHDLRAMNVLKSCKSEKIEVPRSIAILGVDDDRLLCEFSTPTISSIDPNAQAIGRAAAQTLMDMLATPRHREHPPFVVVGPKDVVVRESSEVFPIEPAWLSNALVFIQAHAADGINAADVLEFVGKSHTLVNRTFKAKLGTNVQQQINHVRMELAQRLLKESSLPVKEIALRAGYQSAIYFNRAFSAAHGGVSPGSWRGKVRGKAS